MTAAKVRQELKRRVNPEKATFLPKFFKTGKGEYAEGDLFLGVVVPDQRKIAKQFRDLPLTQLSKLMLDKYHECRLTAVFILCDKFSKSNESDRDELIDFYIDHLVGVNHWDLVDSSAYKLLGAYLFDKNRSLLYELASLDHLWKQRISIVATYFFIKNDQFSDTFKLADILLYHEHDLIHKAVGWMLREVGNRDKPLLVEFLKSRYQKTPRTMLRYAIEKFTKSERVAYLNGHV